MFVFLFNQINLFFTDFYILEHSGFKSGDKCLLAIILLTSYLEVNLLQYRSVCRTEKNSENLLHQNLGS